MNNGPGSNSVRDDRNQRASASSAADWNEPIDKALAEIERIKAEARARGDAFTEAKAKTLIPWLKTLRKRECRCEATHGEAAEDASTVNAGRSAPST